MMISQRSKRKARKGVGLLEVGFVLTITVSAVAAGSYYLNEHFKQQLAKSTASHLIELSGAYRKYIQNNYAELTQRVASYAHIDASELKSATHGEFSNVSYLPPDFQMTNGYGQEYVLSLRNLGGNMLQGAIYSRDGEVIPSEQALRIAHMIGPSGGFTTQSAPSTVEATLDSYELELTDYGGGGEGGKLVSAIFMNERVLEHEDYLHRNPITGRPELNYMRTDLSLGLGTKPSPNPSWDINNVKNVNILVNMNVGRDVIAGSNLRVLRDANISNNMNVKGNVSVTGRADIKGNAEVGGNVVIENYVHGYEGVQSLKEGTINGSCEGGAIGKLQGHQTTIFCKGGKWISADSVIGTSNGSHTPTPSGFAAVYQSSQTGSETSHAIYCTTPTLGRLTAGQGGMYTHYERGSDKATMHPDCRQAGYVVQAATSDTMRGRQDTRRYKRWMDVAKHHPVAGASNAAYAEVAGQITVVKHEEFHTSSTETVYYD